MTASFPQIGCPLCRTRLRFSIATSKKAKRQKAFIMLVCPVDRRHFRGFIGDQDYVRRVIDQLNGERP